MRELCIACLRTAVVKVRRIDALSDAYWPVCQTHREALATTDVWHVIELGEP